MMSRRSAFHLAECYELAFTKPYVVGYTGRAFMLEPDALRDYLFLRDHDADFIRVATSSRQDGVLKRFIMGLHTGESRVRPGGGYLDALGETSDADRGEVLLKVAEDMLGSPPSPLDRKEAFARSVLLLRGSLELDGYVLCEGKLVQSEESVLDEEEIKGYLARTIEELGFARQETGLHHLKQAEEDYLAARWDGSISQSRKFHEYIMQEVAATHYAHAHDSPIDPAVYDAPGQVRKYLRDAELLNQKEWAAFGTLFSLFSETGSHPYVAEATQARLMWRLALTLSDFMLARLRGFLASAADQHT